MQHTDREILRLALPAFLALIAEPLYLLADSAIVGHLGTAQLAGLGIAGVVLQTIVGLCVFLAYGTTASVARHLGADNLRVGLTQGMDGIWLAALIGVLATGTGVALHQPLIAAFGVSGEVAHHAETYLGIALLGVTPLLLMLAATGVLRGLQDTRTPLYVAVLGNALNVVLNVLLVFGLGPVPALGIAGAALGSVLAQGVAAAILVRSVVRAARREGASLRPHFAGVLGAAREGIPLLIRTLTLRAALLLTTYSVTLAARRTPGGDAEIDLATHQIAFTVWTFLAFALDAVAIAAQALTGRSLGAGDLAATRALTRRMVQWGIGAGVVLGLVVAGVSGVLGPLFTTDPAVRAALVPVLVVVALGQPLAGLVFILDGVLIGAGDGRYLARAGLLVLALHAPATLLVGYAGGSLVAVWCVLSGVFMGARGAVLVHRARSGRWMVTGATLAASGGSP